jgi:hypothetical protein
VSIRAAATRLALRTRFVAIVLVLGVLFAQSGVARADTRHHATSRATLVAPLDTRAELVGVPETLRPDVAPLTKHLSVVRHVSATRRVWTPTERAAARPLPPSRGEHRRKCPVPRAASSSSELSD